MLLLLSGCFLCWPLWATGDRIAAGPLAEPLTAQPGQTAGPQSSANETGPLFPVGEHGRWGYIDKTGKIVIPLQYYLAYPFSEGLALIQPFPVLGSRAIRVLIIDKTGMVIGSKIYSHAYAFSEGLALVV